MYRSPISIGEAVLHALRFLQPFAVIYVFYVPLTFVGDIQFTVLVGAIQKKVARGRKEKASKRNRLEAFLK